MQLLQLLQAKAHFCLPDLVALIRTAQQKVSSDGTLIAFITTFPNYLPFPPTTFPNYLSQLQLPFTNNLSQLPFPTTSTFPYNLHTSSLPFPHPFPHPTPTPPPFFSFFSFSLLIKSPLDSQINQTGTSKKKDFFFKTNVIFTYKSNWRA